MRPAYTRATKQRDPACGVEFLRECLHLAQWGYDGAWLDQWCTSSIGMRHGPLRHVAGQRHDRDAATTERLLDGDMQQSRHLLRLADQLTIVAAFSEKPLRVSLLEVVG